MWLLFHLVIVVALTLTTTWGGLVWLTVVVAFRLVRRGVRLIVLLLMIGLIGLAVILNSQPTEARGKIPALSLSTRAGGN